MTSVRKDIILDLDSESYAHPVGQRLPVGPIGRQRPHEHACDDDGKKNTIILNPRRRQRKKKSEPGLQDRLSEEQEEVKQ